jgi:hypothetical protein
MKKFKITPVAAFAGICLLCTAFPVNSIAGVMPIPIFYGGGGGCHISPTQAIGLLIAINIPMVLIYIIRSIMWAVKRNKHEKYDNEYSFVEYVIWSSDYDSDTPIITTSCFVILNGMALIVWIAQLISNAL